MKLTRILIFIFAFLPLQANAKLAISSWQESAQLTSYGKSSEIVIRGRVTEIPPNKALSSFAIVFDPRQQIKINRVINDNKLADYSKSADFNFTGNALSIKFPQGKKNNDEIAIYIYYDEKYDKLNDYLRHESIYVPAFAAGAKTTVTFHFPGYFESATFNPNLTKVGNSFVYSNIVPANGVQEIIKLTPARSVWDVSVKTLISSGKPLGKVVVKVPTFFRSTHQKVDNYNISSNITPISQTGNSEIKSLNFNSAVFEVVVSNNARITTGIANRRPVVRNAADYIRVSDLETKLLSSMLEQIKNDPKYGNIPLYAKIGTFVNEYLRYDIRYLGKLPQLSQIVQDRVGVCTEYAKLYDGLARMAGIPSVIIEGAACGEYQQCQGHSWNMIYHSGRWIEVDPTWNLMSGIVSSSHVYFNDYGKGETGVEYFENDHGLKIKVDLEMKNVL